MEARQKSKEQERSSTKKSVLDALRSLKPRNRSSLHRNRISRRKRKERDGVMSNVRFDELELMLMAMFEQPTLKDTIQVLTEVQPLVAEDAEMSALVQQTIPKMQRLNEQQFKGLELEWHRPEDDAGK